MIREFVDDMDRNIDEFESMMTKTRSSRREPWGRGAATEMAVAWSITGPMLRASGIPTTCGAYSRIRCTTALT